jgi:hypothetical protein
MFVRMFVAVSFVLFSHGVLADSLDLNLGEHSVQFVYGRSFRSAEMTVGALHVEKGNNPGSHQAVHLGLIASGEPRGTSRFEAGLGGRLYLASAGSIGGYAYYAPDIVAGIDVKRLWEAGARVEFELVRNTANLYVGYRRMEMRLENNVDVTVDKGGHAGVRIVF